MGLRKKKKRQGQRKELTVLKNAYKKGLLKFDSKTVAKAILKEFKSGMTK